ncbi:hypothetical protein K443DRAFT_8215 [Laccaria amethystina LaAM-08-1]|uniref:Uncharacterized protein n=1 Tax=Laccaria amethystina LaAM-08-1 TaxID=1095629 RepID=A0A0C9XDR2_9AGAR|nr:hypothetical protein K443DRAFT_8215 [Laccaria amethystina LaAM-08-1]
MKAAFLGVTAHWINVKRKEGEETWEMRSEVIGFRSVSGDHSGKNLGQYFVGVCDRIGIMNTQRSKLHTLILNNTSRNTMKCETIEATHLRQNLPSWSADENQLP